MLLILGIILLCGGALVLANSIQSIRTAPVRNIFGIVLAAAMIAAGIFLFIRPESIAHLFQWPGIHATP